MIAGSPSSRMLVVILLVLCAGFSFSQNIDLDQVRADEEFRWGVRAFHNGFYNEAILSLQKSLSFKPGDTRTRLWLGRAYRQSGFDEAGLAEWKAVSAAGAGTPLLENLIETMEARRSLIQELFGSARWVVAGEISGGLEEEVIFRRPAAVRARRDGSFYVAGFLTNQILLLDSNGVLRDRYRGGLQGFDHPFDIVRARDGTLYVSEFKGDRVAKLDRNGNKLAVIGGKGREPGKLLGPQYLALDPEGNLYVSDWGNRRVSKFNRDGEFLLNFGRPGEFYPGFLAPTGIAFHNGNVYVADGERKHIAVFDPSGNYLATLLEGRLNAPEGLTVLENGTFLVSDTNRLFFYNLESGTLTLASDFGTTAKRILNADLDANGNIIAADFDGGTVRLLSELSGMHSGLSVGITRVTSTEHPEVLVDVQVTDRLGRPVVGLGTSNFIVTENRLGVQPMEMIFASHRSEKFDISLIVDRSPEMGANRQIVERIARDVGERLLDSAEIRVISPGSSPSVVSRPGDTPELMANAAADRRENYRRNWAFDLGVRLGVTELVGKRNRKAVFYITGGSLPENAFSNFGLQETLNYMKNNSVVFYPIYASSTGVNEELEYLSRETGGRSYRFFDTAALTTLADDLGSQKDGGYLLRYRSTANTDFGRTYIPVEVEATLIRRSGRDEAGYFGPLTF